MKKKPKNCFRVYDKSGTEKILTIMKFSLLLMIFALSNLQAKIFSQSFKIDLHLKNVSFMEAIENIESKTDLKFLYRPDLIDIQKNINIETQETSLDELLSELLRDTKIGYTVINANLIVLSPIQQTKISGTVTDLNTGDPLAGAYVMIKGGNTGAVTDADGKYSVDVAGNEDILVFSSIGYLTEEVAIVNRLVIDIALAPDIKMLEEVVVIGYGTMKKADLTGSLSAVSGKVLEKNTVANPLYALQGKAAGISITPISGQPGADIQVRIRGIQSANASNSPIYIIDGIIAESMGHLNLNDIENISILKDASSTAIYGSRAANGVVLITTKRGSKGVPVIHFNTYQGVRTPSNLMPELLNASEFLMLSEEAYTNSGQAIPWTDETIDTYYRDENGNIIDTDWLDIITRKGKLQFYDLSISGGSERSNYFISTNYQEEKGIIKGQGQEKLSFRFNSDHEISKYLKFGNTLNIYSNKNYGLPSLNYTNYSNSNNPYLMALRKTPFTRPYEEDGSYGYTRFDAIEYRYIPPHLIADEFKRSQQNSGFMGNIYLSIKPFEGLTITPKISASRGFTNSSSFTPTVQLTGMEAIATNKIYKYTDNTFHWQADFMVEYEKTFLESHNLKTLLVYSQEESKFENLEGSRDKSPLNSIPYLDAADPSTSANGNSYTDWAFVSYLGRLNYDYKSKYLLQATIRRDGSSRFSEENRWGVFPSISLGWRISQEKFFSSLKNIINDLKLRASIGTVGNALVGNYTSYASLATTTYVLSETIVPAYNFQSAVNTDLKWESTRKKDFGLDASFLKSKITVSANYFISNTTDMLFSKSLPKSAGKSGGFMVNGGEFENRGIELDLGLRNNRGSFGYDFSINFTHQQNEVIDLNGQDLITSGLEVGSPAFSYYGYKTNGIIRSQADLDAAPTRSGLALGDVWQLDAGEADGVIGSNDQTIIGKRYPDFTYGFNAIITYKNMDASIQLQGAHGFDLPYTTGNYFMGNAENNTVLALERWHQTENPDGNMPRLNVADPAGNFSFSDFWLSDASYLRVNNITVSYNIPQPLCNKVLLKSTQIYLSVQNLYTFTRSDYRGVEVDMTYSSSYYGNPSLKMPLPRTWTMGLKISL